MQSTRSSLAESTGSPGVETSLCVSPSVERVREDPHRSSCASSGPVHGLGEWMKSCHTSLVKPSRWTHAHSSSQTPSVRPARGVKAR